MTSPLRGAGFFANVLLMMNKSPAESFSKANITVL